MSNGVVCPKCDKNDQSQKVSAIVMAGTQSYQASGPTVGTAFVGDKFGLATGFTTVSGVAQTALARQLMPPAEPKKPGWESLWSIAKLMVICVSIFLWFITIPLLALLYYSGKPEYEAKMQQWKNQMGIWNRLYYCYRDDWVFDPKTREGCNPGQMDWLLQR